MTRCHCKPFGAMGYYNSAVLLLIVISGNLQGIQSQSSAGLLVSYLSTANVSTTLSYADHGTGAHDDLQTFRLNVNGNDSWYIVGDLAVGNYDPLPATNLVVVKAGADPSALARPTAMNRMWDDRHTGGDIDGGFYTAVCPSGYAPVGSVGIYISDDSYATPANFPTLACVAQRYLQPGGAGIHQVWNDHGSGGTFDGSVWAQDPLTIGDVSMAMPFVGQSGYDAPPMWTFNASMVALVPPPSDCAPSLIALFNMAMQKALPTINAMLPAELPASVGDCSRGSPPQPCLEAGKLWSSSESCVYDATVYNAKNFRSLTVDTIDLSCAYDTYHLGFGATLAELAAYLHIDVCPVCACTTFVDATCNPGDACDVYAKNEGITGHVSLGCNAGKFVGPVTVDWIMMDEIDVKIDIGVTTIDVDITSDIESAVRGVLGSALNAITFPCPLDHAANCTIVGALNSFPFCKSNDL
eukprot:TRINITY_DN18751_c0_g1_i1.p1 TRINITY_DN18751_c0_g1~~TRINITY_DN18751_c0_g1_i1.p1  ORF type:complete len:468 (-),score=146.61 TRINITY_DN18751_c0_g1_i1:287-1690(-)